MSIATRRLQRTKKVSTTLPAPRPKIGWVEDGYYQYRGEIRMPPVWALNNGSMLHVVLNVGLNHLVAVTASGTTYIPDSIESRIKDAKLWNDNPANAGKQITIHIRLHVGQYAPPYWKTACGTVNVADKKFVAGGADVPQWWEPIYLTLYTQAMNALAAPINNNPIIGSVNAPGAAYFYPEPMLFFPGDANTDGITNQQALNAAGWTSSKHFAFMMEYPKRHSVFKKVVELDLNPPVFGGVQYKDFAQVLIDTMPHGYAQISNYSMAMKRLNGPYLALFDWLATITDKAWVGVQLARSHVISDPDFKNQVWDDLADLCISKGYHFVETPGALSGKSLPDGTKQGTANAWPGSFEDEPATLAIDTAAFKLNPGPVNL